MSDLEQNIKRINNKLQQLLKNYQLLQKENKQQSELIKQLQDAKEKDSQQITALHQKINILKAAAGKMTGADRIQKFEMSLATLGGVTQAQSGMATGTARDDLVLGSLANEVLSGGAGDDRIHSAGGSDTLSGGSGADVFVFDAAPGNARIVDFELHTDRIDLSDWGNLYSVAALQITATGSGAVLSFGGQQISVATANGLALTASDFSADDFIF